MQITIKNYIDIECDKLIARHNDALREAHENRVRFTQITTLPSDKPEINTPKYWVLDNHFNPFHVRSRGDSLAHAIAGKIRTQTYVPRPALIRNIPKPGGGFRQITIFTATDSAVALYLFRLMLSRNAQLFSSYSFAYRADRNAHHAIQHLSRYTRGQKRQYILEYDFTNYFDSISHEYLLSVIDQKFKVSPRERYLIEQFLKCNRANGFHAYSSKEFQKPDRGIPQGSSLSLFLANVACVELDIELERAGATFARYADDTVIICPNYEVANRCANLMLSHGKRSQTEVNFNKSDGISLLTIEKDAEIRIKESFNFLGHSISQTQVSVSNKSINRIKKRISTIIYRHLLHHPKKTGKISKNRFEARIDWDLVTCINELRRYIYGRIPDRKLTRCLRDKSESLVLSKSLLSYYPLVDAPEIFSELDGWLVNVLERGLKERSRLLTKLRIHHPVYTRVEIIDGSWYKNTKIKSETNLPSFFKSWLYVRKCLNVYGIQSFPNPPYY